MRNVLAPLCCVALSVACTPEPARPAPVLAPPASVSPTSASASAPPRAPAPPTKPRRIRLTEFRVEAEQLKLASRVSFEAGNDKLSPASNEALEVVHDYLDARPEITLLGVEGRADSEPTVAANQVLSEKRALAVARWLIGVGVKCSRLAPVGLAQPNASVSTEVAGITFVNVELKGQRINDQPGSKEKPAGDPCK